MTATNASKSSNTTWAFRAKFRRESFGWRGSRLAIERIAEALTEIRASARHDPVRAAEGAVLFLERLSPAICQVDSSSGALGSAAHAAVGTLVPLIASAPVSENIRAKWLERLFEALQEDDPPYLESLGDHWGELCATPALASRWADDLLPMLHRVAQERSKGTFAWFKGTGACYSALFKAGRHGDLLDLLARNPRPIWHDLVWGGRVLLARGEVDAAIEYVNRSGSSYGPQGAVARFAEDALLHAGRTEEAYAGYAIEANQAQSRLATYRAIAKKYPQLGTERLMRDLIASTPGNEGKWFATAKSLKRFDLASELVWVSPCDPKTLARAARDHLEDRPAFAMQAAMGALHWIAAGYGYEITVADAIEARRLAANAAERTGHIGDFEQWLEQLLASKQPSAPWLRDCFAKWPSRRS
jgi:hypothetical protein